MYRTSFLKLNLAVTAFSSLTALLAAAGTWYAINEQESQFAATIQPILTPLEWGLSGFESSHGSITFFKLRNDGTSAARFVLARMTIKPETSGAFVGGSFSPQRINTIKPAATAIVEFRGTFPWRELDQNCRPNYLTITLLYGDVQGRRYSEDHQAVAFHPDDKCVAALPKVAANLYYLGEARKQTARTPEEKFSMVLGLIAGLAVLFLLSLILVSLREI